MLRRTVPAIIVFIMGVLLFAQAYVPSRSSEDFLQTVNAWARLIGAFALVLGMYSLCHLHARRIRRQAPGWGYSVFMYLGLGIMLVAGYWGHVGATPGGWVYTNLLVPPQATVFSLLAFYIASAAFRTFRARTVEAALLLVFALLMMFGRVPLGNFISDQLVHLEDGKTVIGAVVEWILNVPNTAAKRGILLGVALGGIGTSLRIIFGIERSYLGGGER